MPEVKFIAGHSGSVAGVIRYLTRDGRAIAEDYVNCMGHDPATGKSVVRQMDEMRELAGTGGGSVVVGRDGRRRASANTYTHFILSPDPRDRVSLDDLRELVVGWCERWLGEYQCAIYYHDDNEGHVPHAHVVANNANVVRGGTLSSHMDRRTFRRMNDDLQAMARERGLSGFAASRAGGRPAAPMAPGPAGTTRQREYRTRQEKALEDGGKFSWKRDVRDRLAFALLTSRTEEDFVAQCGAVGITVTENARGEWVYVHPGRETWRVGGRRLGMGWTRWGVQQELARVRASAMPRPDPATVAALNASMVRLTRGDTMPPYVIGVTRDMSVTAADVARMVDLVAREDIRSMDDFMDAARRPMAAGERRQLNDAWRLAREMGWLREHRDLVDGERRPRSAGSGLPVQGDDEAVRPHGGSSGRAEPETREAGRGEERS